MRDFYLHGPLRQAEHRLHELVVISVKRDQSTISSWPSALLSTLVGTEGESACMRIEAFSQHIYHPNGRATVCKARGCLMTQAARKLASPGERKRQAITGQRKARERNVVKREESDVHLDPSVPIRIELPKEKKRTISYTCSKFWKEKAIPRRTTR